MKHWHAMTIDERCDRVRKLEQDGVSRTDQAARLGLSFGALAKFCSVNKLTASNDNQAATEWNGTTVEVRVARIKEMMGDHMDAADIAKFFGISDAALRKFCHRNTIVGNSQRRIRREGPPMIPVAPEPPETWWPLAVKNADGTVREPVSLVELEDGMCRWPVGDATGSKQLYCGCATGAAGSYCGEHAPVARHGMRAR